MFNGPLANVPVKGPEAGREKKSFFLQAVDFLLVP
jgi:hypothetical protein